MSLTVRLEGGPHDGQRVTLAHPLDVTVYVPTGEARTFDRYRRGSTRDRVASYLGVHVMPTPAPPDPKRKTR